MPELERAILRWRLDLRRAGLTAPETLDELESHLRDTLTREQANGLAPNEAFAIAAHSLGPPEALRKEHDKSGTAQAGSPKQRILLGACAAIAAVAGLFLIGRVPHSAGLVQLVLKSSSVALLLTTLAALAWICFECGRWLDEARSAARCRQLNRGLRWSVGLAAAGGVVTALSTKNNAWLFLLAPVLLFALFTLSFLAGLDRQRRSRSTWRSYSVQAACLMGGYIVWSWYAFAGPGYYRELDAVRASIAALPEVQLVDLSYHRDLDLEDIKVTLRLSGGGLLEFYGVTPSWFIDTSSLGVTRIGEYRVRIDRYGYFNVIDRDGHPVRSQAVGFGLDIGPAGEFAPGGRLAFAGTQTYRSIPEAIAGYDKLHAAVAALATLPEGHHVEDSDGTTHHYVAGTVGPDGLWPRR